MVPVRRSLAARTATVLGAGALLLGGCAADQSPPPAAETETAVEPTEDPAAEDPGADDAGAAPSHSPEVQAAVADLARTLQVDEASVEVVSQEAVTWRNGSLGCAKPGWSYTQALVEGSRLVLRVGGTDHEYHSGGTRALFHCPKPTE